MKIAQIVCSFPPYKGGIGNSAWRLKKLLSPEINLETFTFSQREGAKDEIKDDSIHYLKPILSLGQAAFLPQLFFRLNKFNIIVLHYPFFGATEIIYLQKLLKKKNPKLIIFYHMDISKLSPIKQCLSLSGKIAGKKLLQQADKIIVSSYDYIQNSQIKNLYHRQTTKFLAIPFSIDTNKFIPDKKIESINENRIDLLFVGGLDKAHYFKGVNILIKALASTKSSNWYLNIIGSGDLLPGLKDLAKKLKIIDKINFTEKVSTKELIKAYQKADILLLPSINSHEAFGLVIIEAMACATAIIASDLAGVRTVFNKESGLKVLPGSVNDLRDKLEYLLTKPAIIKKMKINSRLEAEEKYSLKTAKKNWHKALL